jgi:hypothetical protein
MSDDELLELLITGQLQPSDPAVVAAFAERPALASRWDELQELRQVLTHAGSGGAPEALAPERADRVAQLVRARLAPRRPWLAPVMLTAAAALIGAWALQWQQIVDPANINPYLGVEGEPSRARALEPTRLRRGPEQVVRWPDADTLGPYRIQIFTRGEGEQLLYEDTSSDPHYVLNDLAQTLPEETLWVITWKEGKQAYSYRLVVHLY